MTEERYVSEEMCFSTRASVLESLDKSEQRAQASHSETHQALAALSSNFDTNMKEIYKLLHGNGKLGLVGSVQLLRERQDTLLASKRELKERTWDLVKLGLPWLCLGIGAGIGAVIGIAELFYG